MYGDILGSRNPGTSTGAFQGFGFEGSAVGHHFVPGICEDHDLKPLVHYPGTCTASSPSRNSAQCARCSSSCRSPSGTSGLPREPPRVNRLTPALTRGPCPRTRFSLAENLELAATAGAGRMAPPASTRISTRIKCVQVHVSSVNLTPHSIVDLPQFS